MRRRSNGRTHQALPGCEPLESRALLSTVVAHGPAGVHQAAVVSAQAAHFSFLGSIPATPNKVVSTVPASGDVNPYGIVHTPFGWLVSNFNNSANLQGTGSTIVRIAANGTLSTFFTSTAPDVGLTTALGVLSKGYVLVGSLPTTDNGTVAQGPGALLVIDRFGHEVARLSDPNLLDGPWDLTVSDHGDHAEVYVSNVLNGTVSRLEVKIHNGHVSFSKPVQIASGYTFRTDPAALVVGPTGLAYNSQTDTLYVASTGDNAIYAIPHAARGGTRTGTGTLIYTDSVHLHGPLGLVLLPNGNLITANGDAVNVDPANPSTLVEFTPRGRFINQYSLANAGGTPGAAGAAFGLALDPQGRALVLGTVNDATNSLDLFHGLNPAHKD
jgi:hypothetical protein